MQTVHWPLSTNLAVARSIIFASAATPSFVLQAKRGGAIQAACRVAQLQAVFFFLIRRGIHFRYFSEKSAWSRGYMRIQVFNSHPFSVLVTLKVQGQKTI